MSAHICFVGTYLDKFGKRGIATPLPFKLVLAVELMGSVLYKRTKVGYVFDYDVTDTIHHVGHLLALEKLVAKFDINTVNVQNVPENLGDKILPSLLGHHRRIAKAFDPCLCIYVSAVVNLCFAINTRTSLRYSRSLTKSDSV